MKKYIIFIGICLIVLYMGGIISDKITLRDNIIRLHIVANSDEQSDQEQKLLVRDAVVNYLQPILQSCSSQKQAKTVILENLANIQKVSNQKLHELGSANHASVTLIKEQFGIRVYDTFQMPSGIYDSLKIEIGDGSGKNWWCVVFPSLCLPRTTNGFRTVAVSSGFDTQLVDSLTADEKYTIRFFFLDCLGRIETLFFGG